MKLKKKHAVLILSAAVLSFIVYTFAFFTGSDVVTNRFSGENHPEEEKEVDIVVTEKFDPPPEKNDYPFQKTVQIKNTGNTDCYIRVRLEFSSSEIRDISQVSNDDDKDRDEAYINAADFPFSTLPEGWEYKALDGFYYYTQPVPPGQYTTALIKWVRTIFPDDRSIDTDEYDILVYSEAVAADDINGERMTYEDAWK